MASKRKSKRRRRGMSLRLPSGETTTPVKMVWGAKPKDDAKPAEDHDDDAETAA